jgi:hypothetical protein
VPPTLLATLITAQHFRPFQGLPMMFPPVLLFSSYLNLSGYKKDSAGITAAWSGLYALLAMRRKHVSTTFIMNCLLFLRNTNLCPASEAEVWRPRNRPRRIIGPLRR